MPSALRHGVLSNVASDATCTIAVTVMVVLSMLPPQAVRRIGIIGFALAFAAACVSRISSGRARSS